MRWEVKPLGELCERITKGSTPTSYGHSFQQDGVNFVKVESLTEDGRFLPSKFAFVTEACHTEFKRSQLQEGDILISIAGTLGRTAIVTKHLLPANTNQALAIVRLEQGVPIHTVKREFVVRFIQNSTEQIASIRSGTAQPNLSLTQLKNFLIPIPPLEEQERIVEVLDEAFAAIDKAKANIERNLSNARELFQSRLNDIFSNPSEDWEVKPLGEVCSKIGSGATPRGGRSSYKQEGISLIRSMNVHDLKFASKGLAFIDELQAKGLDNVALFPEDVLLNITGASITRCCVVDEVVLPARVNQHVSILRPIEMLDSDFLALMLVSDCFKKQLLSFGEKGATRQALTKSFLQDFLVRVPSVETQEKVVTELGVLRRNTKAMEGVYQSELDNLEELRQSILEQAFEGKLNEPVAA